jgi:ribonuclease D
MIQEDQLAYDSEFIRERTFYPELCLIQLATKNDIAVIDCQAEIELDLLFSFLANYEGKIIMHGCMQDLEILSYRSSLPKNICDTQLASGLTGFKPQIGLQALCDEMLGINLPKTLSRSNWLKRPLSTEEINYAADDVRYLIALFQMLSDELVSLDRMSWFFEDCVTLKKEATSDYPVKFLYKVLRSNKKPLVDPYHLLALIQWREERAKKLNKPRQWILADRYIKMLAFDRRFKLSNIPSKSEAFIAEAIDVISQEKNESNGLFNNTNNILSPEESDYFYKNIETKASALNIYKEVISSKVEVNGYLRGEPNNRYESSWRKQIIQDIQFKFSELNSS